MHKLEYPQSAIDFIMHRRGKLHIYEALDPAKTALIVVDMQSAFVAEGAAIETPAARESVPNINRLAAACRAAGAMLFKHGGAHDIFIHKGYMLFCDTFGSPDWQNNPGGRLYFAGRAVDEAF